MSAKRCVGARRRRSSCDSGGVADCSCSPARRKLKPTETRGVTPSQQREPQWITLPHHATSEPAASGARGRAACRGCGGERAEGGEGVNCESRVKGQRVGGWERKGEGRGCGYETVGMRLRWSVLPWGTARAGVCPTSARAPPCLIRMATHAILGHAPRRRAARM
eukprot:4650351-Prymnesium_polylepis.2